MMSTRTSCIFLGTSLFFGCAATMAMAMANPLPFQAAVVPDSMLAKMTGKGVIGGKIVYFGVQMQTDWTNPASQTPMQGNLNVSFNSNNQVFVPTITYSVSNPSPPMVAPDSNTDVNGAGLSNIHGVTQAIQIGGQNNAIQNSMTLNVVKGTPSNVQGATGSNLGAGTTQVGDVTFTVQSGQLSMLINNEANTIQQGIGSNGAYQLAQIASNANEIQNTMHMTLGVNPSNSGNALQLQQLQSILKANFPTNIP